jgi:membrane associated rhomboid family serine protease
VGGLIPLGDASRRVRGFAAVTTLLILINIFVFFQELQHGNRFVYVWSAIPVRIVHGHRWITLITSMFMHGGWMHIIGNMIYLWAFGREIEDAMGSVRYLFFYLSGGVVAMLAQIMGDPLSRIPSLGASGAIAAVMGAFLITFPRDRIRTLLFFFIFVRITFIPAAILIGFWFLIQVFNVGAVADVRTGGVAYLAHIGGFLFGVATARLFVDQRRIAFGRGPAF